MTCSPVLVAPRRKPTRGDREVILQELVASKSSSLQTVWEIQHVAALSARDRVCCLVAISFLGWPRIQLCESFDQGRGFRGAGVGRLAGCMIPGQGLNLSLHERYAYGLCHGLDGELSPGSEVQDPLLRSAGRRAVMNERPAPVENRGTEGIGNIDCGETRRTERRDQ